VGKYRKTYNKSKPKGHKFFLEQHRVPPKPPHYYDNQKGYCRMCGEVVKTFSGKLNKRARWHTECVRKYNTIYNPSETRKILWKRDRGKCVNCKNVMSKRSRTKDLKWHVDHIRPLYEQKGLKFEQLDLSYWEEDNLQTLCQPCHVAKSAKEAAERADMRKNNL
jgi:5-methylcytosine-specific restriction endonuclease McrA